ncbi:winged helix-turn-helix transcriptional regulator [Oleiharenicola lentus]|uniref:winged helix-turn-helix transcriptional regulator n=1 Tax=Oleiharenicola lentus TaxID=2508720 RepID=UPI003F665DF2
MGRTHKKVSNPPAKKAWTAVTAAEAVEQALARLEGRWKFLILFQLFGGHVRRFSDLERAIPAVTQKMLAQQLRQLERDGIVTRKIYPEIPPKVEYSLTEWGQSLCPILDALLKWSDKKPEVKVEVTAPVPVAASAAR